MLGWLQQHEIRMSLACSDKLPHGAVAKGAPGFMSCILMHTQGRSMTSRGWSKVSACRSKDRVPLTCECPT